MSIVLDKLRRLPGPDVPGPAQCAGCRSRATSSQSFFPAGLEPGVDYDFFYLPGIDEQYGKPFLVAGDIYAMFNDFTEARVVMEFFTTGELLKGWMAQGGALGPYKDACLEWYWGHLVEQNIAAVVAGRHQRTLRRVGPDAR